ncbi:beta-lactamase family protein [Sphingomonas sp. R-74633]|uniref:serine hydrolase domain-containing protein n=1 Tax=Sphingomonas sp. R-74633 TaxID=2751188 RepID=UPI0015D1A45C|nr:serine hydrolase domain-containing protein [Sphingomonas sp. R-74633]NYT40080.1 beta-lactamase family protein [Sphingomonas sp. R-74633]
MIDRRMLLQGSLAAGVTALAPVPAWAKGHADDPKIDAFVKANGFAGAIVRAKAGKPVYARNFGLANIAAAKPATTDTVYGIASISKFLTTVTILKLVEAGKLALEAPIATLLPGYRTDTGAKVQLAHLLSNTSGIPNDFIPALKTEPDLVTRDLGPAESVRRFASGDLAFEPGSKFDYALTNWFIVLAIVEAATAKPFEQAMREITLDPLGMTHTGSVEGDAALSYRTVEPPVLWPNPRVPVMLAGGGYFSTAPDLLRIGHAVFDKGFVSPASIKALRTVRVPDQDYSIGGRVRTMTIAGKPVEAAWETGRTAGFRTLLAHRYDTQESIVLLNNTGISQKTIDLFADSLFGAEPRA